MRLGDGSCPRGPPARRTRRACLPSAALRESVPRMAELIQRDSLDLEAAAFETPLLPARTFLFQAG